MPGLAGTPRPVACLTPSLSTRYAPTPYARPAFTPPTVPTMTPTPRPVPTAPASRTAPSSESGFFSRTWDRIAVFFKPDPAKLLDAGQTVQHITGGKVDLTTGLALSKLPYDGSPAIGSTVTKDQVDFTVLADRNSRWTGFHGVAVRDAQGRIGIGFEGTHPLSVPDWIANFRNATGGLSSQYNQAIEFYQQVHQQFGKVDYVVGHSLGGGQANLVGSLTGTPALGINSAPLGSTYRYVIDAVGIDRTSSGVVHLNTLGDPVSDPLVPGVQTGTVCTSLGGPLSDPKWYHATFGGALLAADSVRAHFIENFDPTAPVVCHQQ